MSEALYDLAKAAELETQHHAILEYSLICEEALEHAFWIEGLSIYCRVSVSYALRGSLQEHDMPLPGAEPRFNFYVDCTRPSTMDSEDFSAKVNFALAHAIRTLASAENVFPQPYAEKFEHTFEAASPSVECMDHIGTLYTGRVRFPRL